MRWWKNLFGNGKTKANIQSSGAREPIPTLDGDTPVLVMYISSCANMMIAGEVNYLRSIGKFKQMFDKSKAGDYVLERVSLIVSFLSIYNIQIKDGWDKMWLKEIGTNFDTSKRISEQNINDLFEKRYDFYKVELEVLKDSQFPMPNSIIGQLYKPMIDGELSHKQPLHNMFNIKENLAIWNIITTEFGKMMEKIQRNKDYIYSTKNKP